jgi:hypothetical protein
VFLFTVFPRRRGEVRTHVAVQISLTRVPRESPRLWLPWLVHVQPTTRFTPYPRRIFCANARQLVNANSCGVQRASTGGCTGAGSQALFDDRASRVIDVARDRIDKRLEPHSRRLDELSGKDDRPFVVPVLALIVK